MPDTRKPSPPPVTAPTPLKLPPERTPPHGAPDPAHGRAHRDDDGHAPRRDDDDHRPRHRDDDVHRAHRRDDDDHRPRHRDDDDHRTHRRDDDDHRPRHRDGDEVRLTRIVEREWFFADDDDRPRHRRDDDCDDTGRGPGGGGHGGSGGGGSGGGGRPPHGRPTRPPGTDNGRLAEGGDLTKHDIDHPAGPGVWVGPRGEMYLPYLFMRANAADLGARPIAGAPFWESPDIFILAGVSPGSAPDIPPQLGQVGFAGQPNTLYAHVWNFGKAASNEVIVEFYWCDPSLGIDASTVRLIAQTTTSLGARGSGRSHAVVKCPEPWTPTFVNGGHECLLVRVWDNPADLPGDPKFDAAWNRHVAQRNIHVNAPGEMFAALVPGGGLPPPTPALTAPLTIRVGALYGAGAQVAVERVAPHTMPWLQLHTGARGVFPAAATPTGVPTLVVGTAGGGFDPGPAAASHNVTGDDQHVALTTSDHAPGPGEAHVYRVSASQNGAVFGGYTVVLLG